MNRWQILLLLVFCIESYAKEEIFLSGDLASISILSEKADGITIKLKNGNKKIISIPYLHEDKNIFIEAINANIKAKYVNYGESRITIKNESLVNLSTKDTLRVQEEAVLIEMVLESSDSSIMPSFEFLRPVEGEITSRYGKQRYINDQKRSVHLALDLDGEIGDKIIAPMKGKVVLVKNLFYTGNTVILDHGAHLFTSYAHMNEAVVSEGDFIIPGSIIGYVGSTGRVTGPHLHWTVYFENKRINPEQFLKENFLESLLQ
tara:strand:- start:639 stop:1421 length:783 start_codon:yes stop_codon:yes gene_type:complete